MKDRHKAIEPSKRHKTRPQSRSHCFGVGDWHQRYHVCQSKKVVEIGVGIGIRAQIRRNVGRHNALNGKKGGHKGQQ
jgi:hypothetical protein